MVSNPQLDPPYWWHWDLVLTPHVEARMEERRLSEIELRRMLADSTDLAPARMPGRYVARARHRGRPWGVVLEPDEADGLLYVVTAYPREQP